MPVINKNESFDDAMPMEQETVVEEEGMEEQGESPSAVLPKSILMGKEVEVGDEIILRVAEIGEDGITVSYPMEEEEEVVEEEAEAMPMMAGSGGAGGDLYS